MLLGTDDWRLATYHFLNTDVPEEIIGDLLFYKYRGRAYGQVSLKKKQKVLSSFIRSARTIENKYFATQSGIHVGQNVNETINEYGNPHSIRKSQGFEIYEWNFEGFRFVQGNDPDEEPKPQFTQQIIIFTRDNKIVAIKMDNQY